MPNHFSSHTRRLIALFIALTSLAAAPAQKDAPSLYRADFSQTRLGGIPAGWRDLNDNLANLTWAVDGNGRLRTILKNFEGTLVYEGALANGNSSNEMTDGVVEATFVKTPDPNISLSVIGRAADKDNLYTARFSGLNTLELVKIKAGVATPLVKNVTLAWHLGDKPWKLSLGMKGDELTARVADDTGIEQSRVDFKDAEFTKGLVGLRATEFVAVSGVRIAGDGKSDERLSETQVFEANAKLARSAGVQDYAIIKPVTDVASLNAPFDKLADRYDVIVAGGGCGGSVAAIQAARMGAKVLLIEESDWLGGQMSAAAVTTMDEEGIWFQFPVRERGFYREFHESMVNFYYTRQMDPYRAYASWPIQTEGGYEPKKTRAALYAFIAEARKTPGAVLDVCPSTRVSKVQKDGDKITGVTLESWVGDQPQTRQVGCHVLIEATEYGDVIPLTGARYRVGNTTSDNIDMSAPMQDNTWTAVIRDYPNGIPDHLKIPAPPPGYDRIKKTFSKYQRSGLYIWGPPSKGVKGQRDWRVYFRWRGMADSDSPLVGMATEERHTQCGLNGGNDYDMTVAQLENPAKRLENERLGIYLTLGIIYYFQHEVGANWALAEDEGYKSGYNQRMMAARQIASEYLPLAVHMPQHPYVRESRRAVGVYTLKAKDMGRFENMKHWPTSVAMGDYFMDLHHTEEFLEKDLDPGSWAAGDFAKGGGPFQVPFEVFIPEKIDGMVLAEKNLSQSRLVSGATRLQPITMLTGQAAGAIAATAVKQNLQPRAVNPIDVQIAVLNQGSTLIPKWYIDVPWGTQTWRDSQLLSLYGVLDREGAIHHRNGPLREKWTWSPTEPVSVSDAQSATVKLAQLLRNEALTASAETGDATVSQERMIKLLTTINPNAADAIKSVPVANRGAVTRAEFARACVAALSASKQRHPQSPFR